jgi:hypothetical protein
METVRIVAVDMNVLLASAANETVPMENDAVRVIVSLRDPSPVEECVTMTVPVLEPNARESVIERLLSCTDALYVRENPSLDSVLTTIPARLRRTAVILDTVRERLLESVSPIESVALMVTLTRC